MAEAAGSGGGRSWKRHIVRQLQLRDRAQSGRFLDVVQAYTKLLEKSSLLVHFTEKLQAESFDLQAPRSGRETKGSVLEPGLGPTEALQTLKIKYQGQIAEMKDVSGELAYRIIELSKLLKAKECKLQEQKTRLASLSGRISELEAEHQQLKGQVEDLGSGNCAMKAEYDALRERYQLREGELRRAAEKEQELIESLVRKKVEAAENQNKKNERVKQARLSRELKKATKRTVSIVELDEVKPAEVKVPVQDLVELEGCEKLWKRPFRSASATSMTLARCVDVFKGLLDFRLKRGNSISSGSEVHYRSMPICLVTCLPSRVSDVQEAHFSEVNAVNFSPSSSVLATGGADSLIRLWNVAGGRLESLQTLEGANGSITSIEFDPSGCQILAAAYNNAAQLWHIGDCKSKLFCCLGDAHRPCGQSDGCQIPLHPPPSGDGQSGQDSQRVGPGQRGLGPRCTEVIPVEGKVTSLHISQDQMHLLSCSRDNTLKVIDLKMNNVRQVFRADGFKCGSDWTKAIFSPDKSYALVGSSDGSLYLWNMESGKLETILSGEHRASVNAVAWCFSGQCVVSVDQAKKVVLWK
ncbi:protein Atg16l2 isoform X2 [Dermochelys coriacea]|uniref:protein Atg16l2 isoform X2 n=1 Tax=Dermochelys coriacea TaxID=27794 RepID=UPI001CA957A0|nr:protein Atg16l2 isoform X2 [Dermochelys coriacea]